MFSKMNYFGESMYNFRNGKRARRASETTEIAFAIVTSLCVLFLIITMFNDNLKTLIDHGAFPGVWNPQAVKTSAQSWQIGQKQTSKEDIITSPVVQATSWEAILLQKYNDSAKKRIEEFYNQYVTGGSTAESLTDGDKKVLAEMLAIFASSSTDYSGIQALNQAQLGNGYTYLSFGLSQDITFDIMSPGLLSIKTAANGEVPYNWSNGPNGTKGYDTTTPPEMRVSNIRDAGGIVDTFKY